MEAVGTTKSGRVVTTALRMGALAGFCAFALVGLLPSSYVGGLLGMKITQELFGLPWSSDLIPRIIVGMAMLLGVVTAGFAFVLCGAMAGWMIGRALESMGILADSRRMPLKAYFTGPVRTKKGKDAARGEQEKDDTEAGS